MTRMRWKDQFSEEVHRRLAPLGASLRLARRLQARVVRDGADRLPDAMPEVPSRLLGRLRDATRIPRLELVERAVDPSDGFVKYLFRGDGEEPFETVRIPLLHRPDDPKYVVCVSSQVGCALGCAFCRTARMGFRRQLRTWEIVDQVVRVARDSDHPVRGVVFMGMGEAFANYDRAVRAARILAEPCGGAIAAKAITLSTVGLVPGIRRFTAEGHPFRLVVSLTSADRRRRAELLPVEARHPLEELRQALVEYHHASGRLVTLAWTMIGGYNTREQDARDLAAFARGLPVKIDLIDVTDPSGRFRPPGAAELAAFRDALRAHVGCPVDRRYSGGRAIHAACGLLAGRRVAGPGAPVGTPIVR